MHDGWQESLVNQTDVQRSEQWGPLAKVSMRGNQTEHPNKSGLTISFLVRGIADFLLIFVCSKVERPHVAAHCSGREREREVSTHKRGTPSLGLGGVFGMQVKLKHVTASASALGACISVPSK